MAENVEAAGAGKEGDGRRRRSMEVPAELDSRFLRVGDKLYRSAHDKQPVATITPDRIKAKDRESLPDLIRLAKENGWTAIKVSGDAEFQRAAYLAASAQGIKVDGYKPDDKTKAAAEREQARQGGVPDNQARSTRTANQCPGHAGTGRAAHRSGRAISPAIGRPERQRPRAAQGAKPRRARDGGRGRTLPQRSREAARVRGGTQGRGRGAARPRRGRGRHRGQDEAGTARARDGAGSNPAEVAINRGALTPGCATWHTFPLPQPSAPVLIQGNWEQVSGKWRLKVAVSGCPSPPFSL